MKFSFGWKCPHCGVSNFWRDEMTTYVDSFIAVCDDEETRVSGDVGCGKRSVIDVTVTTYHSVAAVTNDVREDA